MSSLPGVRNDIFITSTFYPRVTVPIWGCSWPGLFQDVILPLVPSLLCSHCSTHQDPPLKFASHFAVFNFFLSRFMLFLFHIFCFSLTMLDLSYFRIRFNEKRQAGTAPWRGKSLCFGDGRNLYRNRIPGELQIHLEQFKFPRLRVAPFEYTCEASMRIFFLRFLALYWKIPPRSLPGVNSTGIIIKIPAIAALASSLLGKTRGCR